MNDNDKEQLAALEHILDMTDESDWHLMHATVRNYVAEGKLSKDGEQSYKALVDKKLLERGIK
jgi:hypothetical protein